MEHNDPVFAIYSLFSKAEMIGYTAKNTSHGNTDFREVIFCQQASGKKLVLKLADNDFTSADRIAVWKQCAEEYRKLGYYCPEIFSALDGTFPTVTYKGHTCVVFAEAFSLYATADTFDKNFLSNKGYYSYIEDAITMNARVAAAHFSFTPFPSAWCAFQKFCPSDLDDEIMENALEWRRITETLPAVFSKQVERIWAMWAENREKLQSIYPQLPTSVFQADINPFNILLDETGRFKGVLDFNICGKEVVINYLFREAPHVMTVRGFQEQEENVTLHRILKAISIAKKTYSFSDQEIQAAPLLYRYQKPLWIFNEELQASAGDPQKIAELLHGAEKMLTEEIDWETAMR